MIAAIERFEELVNKGRTGTPRLSEFFEDLANQVNISTVLTGSGSPEGVVPASPTQEYMDTAGAPGAIKYIKQTGKGNAGWVLV